MQLHFTIRATTYDYDLRFERTAALSHSAGKIQVCLIGTELKFRFYCERSMFHSAGWTNWLPLDVAQQHPSFPQPHVRALKLAVAASLSQSTTI